MPGIREVQQAHYLASGMTNLHMIETPRTTMSSLAANRGLEFLNERLDHLFGASHKYRCFVHCSSVTPPVRGGTPDTNITY